MSFGLLYVIRLFRISFCLFTRLCVVINRHHLSNNIRNVNLSENRLSLWPKKSMTGQKCYNYTFNDVNKAVSVLLVDERWIGHYNKYQIRQFWMKLFKITPENRSCAPGIFLVLLYYYFVRISVFVFQFIVLYAFFWGEIIIFHTWFQNVLHYFINNNLNVLNLCLYAFLFFFLSNQFSPFLCKKCFLSIKYLTGMYIYIWTTF